MGNYLFLESFSDSESSTYHRKWDLSESLPPNIEYGGGRDGGGCWYNNGANNKARTLVKSLPANPPSQRIYMLRIGFAFKMFENEIPPLYFVGGSSRVVFKHKTDQSVASNSYVFRFGGNGWNRSDKTAFLIVGPYYNVPSTFDRTLAVCEPDTLESNEWNHYMLDMMIGVDTYFEGGVSRYSVITSAEVRKNGQTKGSGYTIYRTSLPVASYSLDYMMFTSAYISNPLKGRIDDVYITDRNTGIGGDLIVSRLLPDETVASQWLANQNEQQHNLINEIVCDEDTTYIYANGLDQDAEFKFNEGNVTLGENILGYQFVVHARSEAENNNYGVLGVSSSINSGFLNAILTGSYQAYPFGYAYPLTLTDLTNLSILLRSLII